MPSLPPSIKLKARGLVDQALSEVTSGAEAVRAVSVTPPEQGGRLRRFGYGLALPAAIAGAVLRDRSTRGRYLRVVAVQAAITLAVGLTLSLGVTRKHLDPEIHLGDDSDEKEHESVPDGPPPTKAQKRAALAGALRGAGHARVPRVKVERPAPSGESGGEEDAKEDDDDAADLAAAALLAVGHEKEARASERTREKATLFSEVYGMLLAVEWVVLALSREYQDSIGREASLAAGVPPEDEAIDPRVRINFKWLKKKLRDKIRGALVFAAIAPLAWLLVMVPTAGQVLSGALFVAWGVYWSGVFSTARTGRAWAEEKTAGDPAFLRGLERAAARLPGPFAWPIRAYAAVVRRFTRSLFSPAGRFERSPWEMLGLSLGRTVRYVPVLNLVTRPLFPVGATQIVLSQERRRDQEPAPALPSAAALAGAAPDGAP